MDWDPEDDICCAREWMRKQLIAADVEVADRKAFDHAMLVIGDLWPEHPTYRQIVRFALEHRLRYWDYQWLHDHTFDAASRRQFAERMSMVARRPEEIVHTRLRDGARWWQIARVLETIATNRAFSDYDWGEAANIARKFGAREVFQYCVRHVIRFEPYNGYVMANDPFGNAELVRAAEEAIFLQAESWDRTPIANGTACDLAHVLSERHDRMKSAMYAFDYSREPLKRLFVERIRHAGELGTMRPWPYVDQFRLAFARLVREHADLTDQELLDMGWIDRVTLRLLPKGDPQRNRVARLRVRQLRAGPTDILYWWSLRDVFQDETLPTVERLAAADLFVRHVPGGDARDWSRDETLRDIEKRFAGAEVAGRAHAAMSPARIHAWHPQDQFEYVARELAKRRGKAFDLFLSDVRSRPLSEDEALGLWCAGAKLGIPAYNQAALTALRQAA